MCCCRVLISHRMAGEQRCRHQVRNNCGEIMLQAHKHSPAATHHRCEHQNSQHSDSSRDFSCRNYGEILEDDGSRTVMVILVTGHGAIIKSDLITDKWRWRGLLIVNCICNLLVLVVEFLTNLRQPTRSSLMILCCASIPILCLLIVG